MRIPDTQDTVTYNVTKKNIPVSTSREGRATTRTFAVLGEALGNVGLLSLVLGCMSAHYYVRDRSKGEEKT